MHVCRFVGICSELLYVSDSYIFMLQHRLLRSQSFLANTSQPANSALFLNYNRKCKLKYVCMYIF